ncbi:DUF922 domain-containing protein [Aureimonas populi]|uniref:DUF922 domain-containing protein n=1 Tax=Aureimonas populi TaxID=1701758 RepID=A0ABW5CP32_9HYPH|nr:DUF922 domain-containing protein [Aureimonas populi]
MMRSIACLVAATVALAAPAWAAEVRESTTYFSVRGSTLEEIDEDLASRGPLLASSGMRHPGSTTVSFDGQVTYAADEGLCRVDEVQLALDLQMTLPRWTAPRDASPETALIWNTLASDIERHEREHATIARHWLRRMESALRNLRPERDCARMEERVRTATGRYLAWHEKAQNDFDTLEGREIGFRLRRALRQTAAQ